MKLSICTDTLINIGIDYIEAVNAFRRERHKAGYRNSQEVWLYAHRRENDALWQAYQRMDEKRCVLYAASELLCADPAVIVNAARCYLRYYDKGGEGIPDTGHLIEGML